MFARLKTKPIVLYSGAQNMESSESPLKVNS